MRQGLLKTIAALTLAAAMIVTDAAPLAVSSNAYAAEAGREHVNDEKGSIITEAKSIDESLNAKSTVAAPTASRKSGKIKCSKDYAKIELTADSGATIYYSLNGAKYKKYTKAIKLTKNSTIKTFAKLNGNKSSVVKYKYKLVPKVKLSVGGSGKNKVKVTSGVSDVKFYYTTDGSKPTTKSKAYKTSGIKLTKNSTVRVLAVKKDWSSVSVMQEYIVDSSTGSITPKSAAETAVKIRELSGVLDDKMTFCWCESGVIITQKDGLYGAVNIDGKEIVEHAYWSWWEPNADGQFALRNDEAVFCFDANGNVICTIKEDIQQLFINEGYITYTYNVKSEDDIADEMPYYAKLGVFDIKKGEALEIELRGFGVDNITPVSDGKFYVTENSALDATEICEIDVKTLEQRVVHEDWWCELLTPQKKYGAILASCLGNHWAGLLSTDGTEEHRADILEMIAMYEIPCNKGASYNVTSYRHEGVYYFNRGMQIVIYITSKDDGSEHYFLMDFSKAKTEDRKVENEYGIEEIKPVVTNLKDVIVAQYDYIELSESGNYLASKGDDWFYIDSKGKVIADYVDCSAFVGDYAIVLENDGMAYVVDKKFNKVSKGYPADSVHADGNVLVVVKDGKSLYLYVESAK